MRLQNESGSKWKAGTARGPGPTPLFGGNGIGRFAVLRISAAVYDAMLDQAKLSKGVDMWEKRSIEFAGVDEDVYRTN